jgi:hypothetical protein
MVRFLQVWWLPGTQRIAAFTSGTDDNDAGINVMTQTEKTGISSLLFTANLG